MTETIKIDSLYNGPPTSANGGYLIGKLARYFDGPYATRLYQPPPLDTEMTVSIEEGKVTLRHEDIIVATANSSEFEIEIPENITLEIAEQAAKGYVGLREDYKYHHCYVCGMARPIKDGLHVYTGHVKDDIYASPWYPMSHLTDTSNFIKPEYVVGALDCPAGIACMGSPPKLLILGSMWVHLLTDIPLSESYYIVSQKKEVQGRKHFGASALFNTDNELLAISKSIWIQIDTFN